MSPFSYNTLESEAYVYYSVGSINPGRINCNVAVYNSGGYRPVISLKPCLTITGEGTTASPYVVSTITSTCNSLNE